MDAKPALPPAALTAFIEIYSDIGFLCLKIGRWIIKSNMSIFTDSDQTHIDRSLAKLVSQIRDGRRVAVHQMISPQWHKGDKPFL